MPSLSEPEALIKETLSETVNTLSQTMGTLMEKQMSLVETLENFIGRVSSHEDRIKRLEDSLLMHIECATWIKATIKLWPLILAAMLMFAHYVPMK